MEDGFKVIPLKEKIEDTYLTITDKSLKLSKSTAKIRGMPDKVLFMLNEKRMQIAIVPAADGDEDAIDFITEDDVSKRPIYIKEPAILNTVKDMTVLERDGVKLTQTIKGLPYPDKKVIIYDLGESVETVVKPRGRNKKK